MQLSAVSYQLRRATGTRRDDMAHAITPQLMFEGKAEEATTFYVSLFGGSEITQIERYGPGEQGVEGSVKRASFTLAGRPFTCIDSSVKHAFTFTPSISLFVECDTQMELEEAFERLTHGGAVLMPLDNYGFSK